MEDGSLEHDAAHAHDTLADVHADAAVVLNVGGTRYTTTYGTMRAVEGSYLDALFSGRWERAPRQKGEVFLDRDGEASNALWQGGRRDWERAQIVLWLQGQILSCNVQLPDDRGRPAIARQHNIVIRHALLTISLLCDRLHLSCWLA